MGTALRRILETFIALLQAATVAFATWWVIRHLEAPVPIEIFIGLFGAILGLGSLSSAGTGPHISGFVSFIWKASVNASIVAGSWIVYQYAASEPGLKILVIAIGTILFIVLGPRFHWERRLEDLAVPGREAWSSIVALIIAWDQGFVGAPMATQVFYEKIDIIALILAFAIVSDGLGRSGYFHYAAYYIVERCRGDTKRLMLYLFILTSIFTFFTSNDIVVLILTPIIISVAIHAGIRNAKLLLLSQFVAANTLSMGLLIGSPTNIILSDALGFHFLSYLTLMFPVSVMSFLIAFAIVDFINGKSVVVGQPDRKKQANWEFSPHYETPHFATHAYFTTAMRNWLVLFLGAVTLVGIVTFLKLNLLWSAVPIAAASIILYGTRSRGANSSRAGGSEQISQMLGRLPYGILFFGITYFIFAEALSDSLLFENNLKPWITAVLTNDTAFTGLAGILVGGVAVNVLNDLPAAALIAELLADVSFTNEFERALAIQGLLIGVNIGCYVTPVGALAGLIWFSTITKERQAILGEAERTGDPYLKRLAESATKLAVPTRIDLIRYGSIHFLIAAGLLGALLPFFALVDDFLIGPARFGLPSILATSMRSSSTIQPLVHWIVGGSIALVTITWFARSVSRNAIALIHLRDAFVVFNDLQIWVTRNQAKFSIILLLLVLSLAGLVVYSAEIRHAALYGQAYGSLHELGFQQPLFEGLRGFSIWFLVFVGSGFELDLFPRSVIGMLIVSILPLTLVSIIIYTFRVLSTNTNEQVSERLATGSLPTYRAVLVNYQPIFDSFLKTLLNNKNVFVLVLTEDEYVDAARTALDTHFGTYRWGHRGHIAVKAGSPESLVARFNLFEADEIYFFADRTERTAFENLRFLTILDGDTVAGVDAEPSAAAAAGGTKRVLETVRAPKIVIETESSRSRELIKRSISSSMFRNTRIVSFDERLAEFLVADSAPDLDELNRFFRFSHFGNQLSSIASGDVAAFSRLRFAEYPLTSQSAADFRAHFAWHDQGEFDKGKKHTSDHVREDAIELKRTLETVVPKPQFLLPSGRTQTLEYSRLFGFSMECGPARARLGVPSAAVCRQVETLDGVVLLENDEGGTLPQIRSEISRIVLVNMNPIAAAFIGQLCKKPLSSDMPRILVFCDREQVIPDPVLKAQEQGFVRIINDFDAGNDKLVSRLLPLTQNEYETGDTFLRPGDRVYVFLSRDNRLDEVVTDENPDLKSIDLIDKLHERVATLRNDAEERGVSTELSHRSLYVAVESQGRGTRFLFEHLFIDEIFDSSWIRQSYFENFALSFHLPQTVTSMRDEFRRSLDDFHRADEIASFLSRFVVRQAKELMVRQPNGAESRTIGMTQGEARKLVRDYSNPSMQLIGVIRLVLESETGMVALDTSRLCDLGETVRPDDLLVNVPLI